MEVVGQTLNAEAIAAIKADVWRRVDALPQRDLIKLSDARQWVETVVELHGEQAIWHAIRLNGFGGSEIGVLVRNQHGVRADHQASAHDIVMGKLMRKVPDETNEHMTRGHENEPLHAQKFYKKYGAHRDQAAYDTLTKAQGRLPWMRYSPDEVALIPSRLLASTRHMADVRPMSRWLADYKAPSQVDNGAEIHFQYGCQLAQGAILCEEQGVELHGLMLSQFDWSGWCLKDDVVYVDDQLKDLVRGAGNWAWDFVMRGQVPPYVSTPILEGGEDFAMKNADLARAMASAQALAKASDERARELRELLMNRLGTVRFAGHRVIFPGSGNLSASTSVDVAALTQVLTDEQLGAVQKSDGYDAKKMEARLRELGENMKAFRGKKVDSDLLASKAAEFNIDLEKFAGETPTFRVDKSLKELMESYVDASYPLSLANGPLEQPEQPDQTEAQIEEHAEEAEAPRG